MIRLVPYCSLDGIPTFRDSELATFFYWMEQEGSLPKVFYDGTVTTREEFLSFCHNPKNTFWFLLNEDSGNYIAFCWVNSIEGRSARIHFCTFRRNVTPRLNIDAGHTTIKTILWIKKNDKFLLDCLIGVVPTTNRTACRFIKSIGAIKVGVVPQMLWNAWSGDNMDALITYFTRESHKEHKHESLY